MRIVAVGKLHLRLVELVVLVLAAIGCDNPGAPVPTYTLVSINGALLPARASPSHLLFVRSASLALYSDGTALSRVRYFCDPSRPPDALCDDGNGREFEDTGMYSRETADVTFFGYTNPANFEATQVVITFSTGPYSAGGPATWRYTR
jgi:hypothetical protein